ncbi:MAG TPA: hypothetical protein VGD77_17585 [Gemmatimonadaceae bacterium]
MSPASYHLLYDAAQVPFPGWPLTLGGVVAALLGVALLRVFRGATSAASGARMSGLVLTIFGVTWTAVFGLGSWVHQWQLRAALDDGDFRVVAGTVYDQPVGAEDEDSWMVEGDSVSAWYHYEGPLEGAGFRREGPGAGGLHDGSRVRIVDVNGRIARLEVAR